ncbi:MAG: hypothetical protein BYD32DRAFT_458790 [Podila humilis]|nr:MAG: hypothetical protein BYD32DRAFT_458790 [Podila humilis]
MEFWLWLGEYWLTPVTLTPQQQLDAVNDPGNWPSEQQVREQAYKEYREAYPLSRLPFVGPRRSHFDRMNPESPVFARTRLQMRRAAGLLPIDGILSRSEGHEVSEEREGAFSRYQEHDTLPMEGSSRYQEQGTMVLTKGGISRYEKQSCAVPTDGVPPCNERLELAHRRNKPGFFKRIWNRLSRKVDIQEALASGPGDGPRLDRRDGKT